MNETLLKKAAGMLEQCDGILIGAGSGLSAAAGLNYTDREKFAEIFPAWKRRGFSMQYELVGRRDMTPREMWGYLTVHLNYVYYGQHANPLYMKLREIVGRRDCFVMTSNVDDLFLKSGFDRDRIYTPQGSYGRIQCAAPCSDRTWDLRPRFETLQKALDPVEQVITDEKAIPVCPNCGGPMFLNVRVDSTMSDAPYLPQQERLITWLEGMEDRKLLLLELGAGYNTPVVIRMPMERIAATYREAEMIRVNDRYHQVPDEIRDRSLSVKEDIARFIEGLYQTAGPGRTKLNTGRKLWKRKQ